MLQYFCVSLQFELKMFTDHFHFLDFQKTFYVVLSMGIGSLNYNVLNKVENHNQNFSLLSGIRELKKLDTMIIFGKDDLEIQC